MQTLMSKKKIKKKFLKQKKLLLWILFLTPSKKF